MDGNGERERRKNGGNSLRGLLCGLDAPLLCLNRGECGGKLRVALFFAIAGLLNRGILCGHGRGELGGVMASRSPGVCEEGGRYQGDDANDNVECRFHQGTTQKSRSAREPG